MPTTTPFVYIDAPPVERYPNGLFDAATVVDGSDEHWFYGGIEWESIACYNTILYPGGLNDVAGAGGTKTLPACFGPTRANAFAVVAGFQAGSIGRSPADWEARARDILDLADQHAVEQALWTGSGGGSPALNAVTTPLVIAGQLNTTAGAVDMLTGLGLAEEWLNSNYAGRGIIHVRRDAAAFFEYLQQVKPDQASGNLQTRIGNRWSFGAGYDNTGPGAVAAPARAAGVSYFWLTVTGQTTVYKGETFRPAFEEALDRANNQVRLYAERPYIVATDCAVAAILVKSPTIA